jgi:PEP-CTERM motif
MICTLVKGMRTGIAVSACGWALALTAFVAVPARAAIDDATFTVKISEKEGTLSDPNNEKLMNYLMWDLGADRMVDRNMPYLELANDSGSDAPITEFRMTIGDTRFHFDCSVLHSCAMSAKSSPGPSFNSAVEDGGDTLLLTIPNGLAAGDKIRFKIALSADTADVYPHPDFRTVLFDMNGINVYDGNLHTPSNVDGTADNAKITVKYAMGDMTKIVGPSAFDDFDVMGPPGQYYNSFYRPYGVMERVDTFPVFGAGTVVPEPGTMALAAFGMVGLVVGWAAPRRRS